MSKVAPRNALPALPHMSNLHMLVDGMKQACASATKEPSVVAALVKKGVDDIAVQGIHVNTGSLIARHQSKSGVESV